jgi:hypothetical protein
MAAVVLQEMHLRAADAQKARILANVQVDIHNRVGRGLCCSCVASCVWHACKMQAAASASIVCLLCSVASQVVAPSDTESTRDAISLLGHTFLPALLLSLEQAPVTPISFVLLRLTMPLVLMMASVLQDTFGLVTASLPYVCTFVHKALLWSAHFEEETVHHACCSSSRALCLELLPDEPSTYARCGAMVGIALLLLLRYVRLHMGVPLQLGILGHEDNCASLSTLLHAALVPGCFEC